MNRFYLPTIFVSSLLILGCGGGGGNTSTGSGSGSGSGSYNPYAGTGMGSIRIKTITSPNSVKTFYYNEQGSPLSGKLSSIIEEDDFETEITTFEYQSPGLKLSKIIVESGPNLIHVSMNRGTVLFEPTVNAVIASTTHTIQGCGNVVASGETTYKYILNSNGNATRLKEFVSIGQGLGRSGDECFVSDAVVRRTYAYDNSNRLIKVIGYIGNKKLDSYTYSYDSLNRVKNVRHTGIGGSGTLALNYQGSSHRLINASSNSGYSENYTYETGSCFYHYEPNFYFDDVTSMQSFCPH